MSKNDIWEKLSDNTRWFLLSKHNVKLVKRRKIPQDIIDLMNGKKIKVRLPMKDLKMCFGEISNE